MPFTVFVSQRMEGGAQGGREVSRSRFTKYLTPSREKQIRYWWGKKRLVWRIDSCWITSNVKLCLFSSPTLHTSFCLITVSCWCSNLSHVHTLVTHSTQDILFSKAIRKIFMVRVHCCRITLHEDKPGHDSWELEAKFGGSLTNFFSIFPRSSHACETRGRNWERRRRLLNAEVTYFLISFWFSFCRSCEIIEFLSVKQTDLSFSKVATKISKLSSWRKDSPTLSPHKKYIVRGLENVKLINSDKRIIDGLEM